MSRQQGRVHELDSALTQLKAEYEESEELVQLLEKERNVSGIRRW